MGLKVLLNLILQILLKLLERILIIEHQIDRLGKSSLVKSENEHSDHHKVEMGRVIHWVLW